MLCTLYIVHFGGFFLQLHPRTDSDTGENRPMTEKDYCECISVSTFKILKNSVSAYTLTFEILSFLIKYLPCKTVSLRDKQFIIVNLWKFLDRFFIRSNIFPWEEEKY
jgi:hypothetical protein